MIGSRARNAGVIYKIFSNSECRRLGRDKITASELYARHTRFARVQDLSVRALFIRMRISLFSFCFLKAGRGPLCVRVFLKTGNSKVIQ